MHAHSKLNGVRYLNKHTCFIKYDKSKSAKHKLTGRVKILQKHRVLVAKHLHCFEMCISLSSRKRKVQACENFSSAGSYGEKMNNFCLPYGHPTNASWMELELDTENHSHMVLFIGSNRTTIEVIQGLKNILK